MRKKLLLSIIIFSATGFSVKGLTLYPYAHNTACTESVGYVQVGVSGGVAPYTYLWSTGDTTWQVNNLPAGNYTVTVTDFIGTTASAIATIFSGPVDLSLAYSNASIQSPCASSWCMGNMLWQEDLITGTPPYTFTSSSGIPYPNSPNIGQTTIDGICPGTLMVYVTDGTGCTGQEPVCIDSTVIQSPVLTTAPACSTQSNGTLFVSNLITPSPCGGYLDISVCDTFYNIITGHPLIYTSSDTFPNLSAGSYYLKIDNSFSVPGWCGQYFPFTIPSLGNSCSTVEGNVYADLNANCVQDVGEAGVPNTVIEFTPGPWYGYSNSSGHYSANLPWGNFNMTHYPPVALTQLCPANPYAITLSSSNTTDTVNFADTSNIPFDVSAYIGHGAAHPGFNFNYGVSVHNNSYTPSGMLTVTLNYDPLLSFVSANPPPFLTSAGQVVWHLNSITNFQSTSAYAVLSVPPNPALLGDTLFANVNVLATTAEANLSNNTATTWHIITGSFDPNVKTVESPASSFIPAADGWFNYTIQFQNTGNDTAFNIEVIDSLDSDLNVTTFVPGAASHPFTIDITGQGVLHFYFNTIYLPDSTTDEPNSHGFVSFRIRSKQNLPHGMVIHNQSDIVFDFNPPVPTNTTQNTVDLTLAINASATTICAGQSVTLTMIPELQNTAWRWRTGTCSGPLAGNGNSITVSPTVTTTYFVRDSAGTIPLGACYRKTIVVNALPNPSVTPSGPTTFCQGNSVTLTAASTANYLWSTGATTQSINVTSAGNYSVTVTNAAGCSNTSTTVSVTVNPLPIAAITPNGPTTFCQGDSVQLTAYGGNNYLWSNSSTAQSISVSASGNYLVTVTDANNCSALTSVSVTVNPLPTASITPSGPTTFCIGDSVILTSSIASSYLWSTSATTQSITVNSSGNYLVTVTDANNCSASTSLSVTVNSNPPAPNIIQVLDSLFSDLANGYQWYFNNVIISGATSQSYHPTQNGNYSVVITDANGCTASSTGYPFYMTGVQGTTEENDVVIYPNPVRDELVVQSSKLKVESVEVFDVVGRKCLTPTLSKGEGTRIDVSALGEGIYFVKVREEKGIAVRKFVKQ